MAEEATLAPLLGMNQDDTLLGVVVGEGGQSDFAVGGFRYALNLRVGNTSSSNQGAGENIPSTLLVNNYNTWSGVAWVSGSAQSGTNIARGKFEDKTNGQVFWAVQNSNGNHAILYFNKAARQIYELLQWSGLNFSNFVSMTKINKYLILTDGNPSDGSGNPPRCIDVTSIYILKNTLGSNFSEFHISFAKWQPVAPPQVFSNADTGNFFIRTGVYQFAYRYIYIGGFRSCWSPPSNFVTNLSNVSFNGSFSPPQVAPVNFRLVDVGWIYDYSTPSNTAYNHTDPRFYNVIYAIEYGYRDSDKANWKVFSRNIINADLSKYVALTVFYNNGFLNNVAANDIGQYFDSVPLLSRSVEAIDNRPMFGNNLDDLAPMPDFAVTNVEVYSKKPQDDTWLDYYHNNISAATISQTTFKENGVYRLGIIFKNYAGRSGLVQSPDNWIYTIPSNSIAGDDLYALEDLHALGFKIAAGIKPPIWAVDYQIVRSNCLNIGMFIVGQVNDFKFLTATNLTDNTLSTQQAILDSISGYYDNNTTGGAQYSIISRILSAVRKNVLASGANTANLIFMDIKNWALDTKPQTTTNQNPANNVFYNWQQGDRVRFWAQTGAGTYVQYDQEIIEYLGTSIICSIPSGLTSGFSYMNTRAQVAASANPSTKLFTIEVYRPIKYSNETNVIYYEMGEWYPVLQPGTVNRSFSKTDWTWTASANVSVQTVKNFSIYSKFPVTAGDTWSVIKNFYYDYIGAGLCTVGYLAALFNSYKQSRYIPQMNPDPKNAGGYWERNTGRPLAAYEYMPQQFEKSTQVRFGGKFLEDSIFIGINNFHDDNQKIYPSEYGAIRAMVNTSNTQVKDVGQILMVICEEETMDVYVNRATLQQLGGQTQVTLSDQVLGSYNTLLGSYGTLNPESVSKRNSRVLFWNAKRGMWIRRSIDGLTPVSNYKMQNWFKDLSNLLIGTYATNTPAKVFSVFDPYYEEWVTFINHSSLPSTYRGYSSYKSAAFDEDSKRWNTVYDYAPDIFAALENETYSIIGTVVHIHYAGADYGSIYGVKKDCMWQPVANARFRETKIWKALNMQSTDKWSLPSIAGDFMSNGATAQNSALLLTDLVNKEGTFWADIKRDLNTPNASSPDQAIVNGNVMRSRALTLMLKLDPSVTWYSFINWLVVTFDRSEKTIKN